MTTQTFLPAYPTPDFVDNFEDPELDSDLWVDHYLAHWTTPERSLARYDFDDKGG